jgi:hypothetical protein
MWLMKLRALRMIKNRKQRHSLPDKDKKVPPAFAGGTRESLLGPMVSATTYFPGIHRSKYRWRV